MTQLSSALLPTDDTGDLSSGTPPARAFFSDWRDAINTLIHSSTNPTTTPEDIIDEVVAARNGQASLDAYLDTIVALIGASGDAIDIPADFGENVSAGNAIYLSSGSGGKTAGKWYKTDSTNDYSSSTAKLVGFAPNAVLGGASDFARVAGAITGLSGLTAGTAYYASSTPGGLTSTPPANGRLMGIARSTTILNFPAVTPDASTTVPGLVSIGAQSLAGAKTFTGLSTFNANLSSVGQPLVAPGSLALGSMDARVGGVIFNGTTATGSSTAGVVKLTGDLTVKGNTLTADGKALRWSSCFVTAANTNNKRLRIYYGGTTIMDTGVFTGAGAALVVFFEVIITRTGASAQKIYARLSYGPAASGTISQLENRTVGTLDNTADQIFKVESDAAVANNDIVHDFTIGEVVG